MGIGPLAKGRNAAKGRVTCFVLSVGALARCLGHRTLNQRRDRNSAGTTSCGRSTMDDDGNRVDPPEDAIAPSPAKGEVDADYVVRMSQRVEPTDWPKGTHGRGSRVAGYGVLCLRP